VTARRRAFFWEDFWEQGGLVGGSIFGLKNALKNDCFWGSKMAQKSRFFCTGVQNRAQTISPSAFGDCFAERCLPYKKKI